MDWSMFGFDLAASRFLVVPISWKLCLVQSQNSPYWATVLFLLWSITDLESLCSSRSTEQPQGK